jgi:outer membrane protein
VIAAVGLAGAAAALIYVGALWADPAPPAAPAAPQVRTRVALLNLTYVIKNYKKYQAYQEEIKADLKKYDDQAKMEQAKVEALRKDIQDPKTSEADRAAKSKDLVAEQRKLEDISNEAKQYLGKKSDEQMVILYKEIQEAARRHATERGFDLVLHYNDATERDDYYTPANVARKMQAGACLPLYFSQGMEISLDVVNALNAAYTPPKPTAGATPPAAPAAAGAH